MESTRAQRWDVLSKFETNFNHWFVPFSLHVSRTFSYSWFAFTKVPSPFGLCSVLRIQRQCIFAALSSEAQQRQVILRTLYVVSGDVIYL